MAQTGDKITLHGGKQIELGEQLSLFHKPITHTKWSKAAQALADTGSTGRKSRGTLNNNRNLNPAQFDGHSVDGSFVEDPHYPEGSFAEDSF